MSKPQKLQTSVKPVMEITRSILGAAGNRAMVSEQSKRKPEALKKTQRAELPTSVVRNNGSVDSSCSSDTSPNGCSVRVKGCIVRAPVKSKVVPETEDDQLDAETLPKAIKPLKRCDWITPNSDPVYTRFHDEEWGVPVHDDKKLFEFLVFSQALAELTCPAILTKRQLFRKLLDDFEPSSVAKFTEKKLLSLKVNGKLVLSEAKLHAVVENAKQILKVQQEFGSFSCYCWKMVKGKTVKSKYRYGRQVPAKTAKAEVMSKDMMQRGFRCVGPTIIYSFMQVSGLVNDHLLTCFRSDNSNTTSTKFIYQPF